MYQILKIHNIILLFFKLRNNKVINSRGSGEFIDMLLKYNIGVKEIKAYEVDEDFFQKI